MQKGVPNDGTPVFVVRAEGRTHGITSRFYLMFCPLWTTPPQESAFSIPTAEVSIGGEYQGYLTAKNSRERLSMAVSYDPSKCSTPSSTSFHRNSISAPSSDSSRVRAAHRGRDKDKLPSARRRGLGDYFRVRGERQESPRPTISHKDDERDH